MPEKYNVGSYLIDRLREVGVEHVSTAAAAAHREGRYSFIEAVVAPEDVATGFAGLFGGPAADHRKAATETR